MNDRLNGISVFVSAVEAGSFAQAANRLHLSRSAVGKSIARLEQRLGVRLFYRTTRRLSLTDDGALFYERCMRALDEIHIAEALLESGKRQVSGRLRVSMPVLLGRMCIAPLLMELAGEHPNLALELSFNDRLVDMVEDGFDLVVRNGRLPDSSRLVARRLGHYPMAFYASPAYLARWGEPKSVAELVEHNAVTYIRSGELLNWDIPVEKGKTHRIEPKSRVMMDDLQALADATIAGFGIGWLPCWLVHDHVTHEKLVRILKQYPGAEYEVHAMWPQTPSLPLKVRLAIDMLAKKLPASIRLIETHHG
ncbi:LysR family transcriptional regulator [Serratia sp. NPDC078593]|uniref:LysR family transcriptional regulator n=1 Tax=unclassified Serratia (in: enterobacteria) TaxID=2647522 RepID=UPI0037D69EBB